MLLRSEPFGVSDPNHASQERRVRGERKLGARPSSGTGDNHLPTASLCNVLHSTGLCTAQPLSFHFGATGKPSISDFRQSDGSDLLITRV